MIDRMAAERGEHGKLELSVTVGAASFAASGETAVVLEAYDDFKRLLPSVAEQQDAKRSSAEPPRTQTAAEAQPERSSSASDALPLKPYLATLKLKGNKEKAAAIVAWAVRDGQSDPTLADIEKAWGKTAFKPPKNLARDVGGAETEGWLKEGAEKGTFTITGFGEEAVAGWASEGEG